MKPILSERSLVVVLFIMVLVVFSFAQADTNKIEKMFLNSDPSVTTSLDQTQSQEVNSKSKESGEIVPPFQLR